MKLLILTQKVDINDDLLGFFHDWIKEFAKHCEKITVICLQKGEYDLPDNVKVLSLEKEKNVCKIKYLFNFYKYIWRERKNYNKVFVHMNPEYVVLGGLFWKLLRKKVALWYVHKAVNLKLRIAEKFADVIFTASKESFQLKSKKVNVLGHGVDINKFKIQNNKSQINSKFQIIYVGRISRIKNQELLIKAIEILRRDRTLTCPVVVDFVGGADSEDDKKYLEKLKKIVKEKKIENYINFIGSVPNKDIAKIYAKADLSINLCPTGGVDKAVLESMACGVPVLAFNKTFVKILCRYADDMILENEDPEELAEKIKKIIVGSGHCPKQELRDIIKKDYSLEKLVDRIILSL